MTNKIIKMHLFFIMCSSFTILANPIVKEENEYLNISTTKFSKVIIEKKSGIIKHIALRNIKTDGKNNNFLAKNYNLGLRLKSKDEIINLEFDTCELSKDAYNNLIVTLTSSIRPHLFRTYTFVDKDFLIQIKNSVNTHVLTEEYGRKYNLELFHYMELPLQTLKPSNISIFLRKIKAFIPFFQSEDKALNKYEVDGSPRDSMTTLHGVTIQSKYFLNALYSSLNNIYALIEDKNSSLQRIEKTHLGTIDKKDHVVVESASYILFQETDSVLKKDSLPLNISSVLYCGTKREADLKSFIKFDLSNKEYNKYLKSAVIDTGILGWPKKLVRFLVELINMLINNIVISVILLGILIKLCMSFATKYLNNPSMIKLQTLDALRKAGEISDRVFTQRQQEIMNNSKFSIGAIPFIFALLILLVFLTLGIILFIQSDPYFLNVRCLWVKDGSSTDPYFILPVIGIILQIITLNSTVEGYMKYLYMFLTFAYFPFASTTLVVHFIIGMLLNIWTIKKQKTVQIVSNI